MILAIAFVSVGIFSVLWRKGILGGLIGLQLVSFGLAALAVFAAAKNGRSELGSWYGLSIIVGGLIGSSIGFALAVRRQRSPGMGRSGGGHS